MHKREQRIRNAIRRVITGRGISPEYSILSVADSAFLLDQLERARSERDTWRDLAETQDDSDIASNLH